MLCDFCAIRREKPVSVSKWWCDIQQSARREEDERLAAFMFLWHPFTSALIVT